MAIRIQPKRWVLGWYYGLVALIYALETLASGKPLAALTELALFLPFALSAVVFHFYVRKKERWEDLRKSVWHAPLIQLFCYMPSFYIVVLPFVAMVQLPVAFLCVGSLHLLTMLLRRLGWLEFIEPHDTHGVPASSPPHAMPGMDPVTPQPELHDVLSEEVAPHNDWENALRVWWPALLIGLMALVVAGVVHFFPHVVSVQNKAPVANAEQAASTMAPPIASLVPPSASLQVRGVQDAVFSLLVPRNNYGHISDIHLYAWTQDGALNVNRVALQFALPSLPPGTKLECAKLSLFFDPDSVYRKYQEKRPQQDNAFVIRRILKPWSEDTITWETQPEYDRFSSITLSNRALQQDYKDIDVLPLVEAMMREPDRSHGFLLQHANETPYKLTIFASSDHPNPALHPRLELCYGGKVWRSAESQPSQP